MENEFVTLSLAKRLKEQGFDEECLYSYEYSEGGMIVKQNPLKKANSSCDAGEITAPLWKQADEWMDKQIN